MIQGLLTDALVIVVWYLVGVALLAIREKLGHGCTCWTPRGHIRRMRRIFAARGLEEPPMVLFAVSAAMSWLIALLLWPVPVIQWAAGRPSNCVY